MPIWFWLNIPACTLIFLATVGIPLWMVLRRPGEEHTRAAEPIREPELAVSSMT